MNGGQMGAWRFREYRESDLPALVRLSNLEYPDEPTTVEQEAHWERSYPVDNPRLRVAAEDDAGSMIGMGACEKPFWAVAPGVYMVYGLVDPAYRGRGIGCALLAQFEPYAAEQGAEKLWADCRESQSHSIRFLQAAGFRQFGIRFEQYVDLEQFDLAAFPGAIERIEAAGYRMTTLAELRQVRPDTDEQLYQVFIESALDIPLPGGARISIDYEQWRKGLDNPNADPRYTFLAVRGDQVVGETSLELLKDGPAITNSTGVLREHRGRGVALALKLASLQALKERGYTEARTHNDTENPAILHLNEKIGYHRMPGWLQWEKRLK
jgi:ribosomal protein S18 acetylase RimI-like enzyme